MGLMQSQTLTGTDPLPLLSLLQTGEADGRRAVPKLESASFATSLSAISLITDDQKDQLLIRFLILWSNLFCFTCMFCFHMPLYFRYELERVKTYRKVFLSFSDLWNDKLNNVLLHQGHER